jgi:hypothetical protein
MNFIHRTKCVYCSAPLVEAYSVKDFPIYMGTTTQNRESDLTLDLNFAKCSECKTAQLTKLVPLEVLYENGHAGSLGKTWLRHHKEFSDFINIFASGNLVEIGGAQLVLAKHLEKNEKIKSITVYDTNLSCYGNKSTDKIILKEQFFDKHSVKEKPDAIIHSHVIEHLYDPMNEIKAMADLLEEGKRMFISAPVVDKMMKDKFTNAMNFEHTYGLTKELLREILQYAGLKILLEKDFSDHCVFVSAIKSSSLETDKDYKQDSSYLDDFMDYHNTEVKKIENQLENKSNTFIFGAHIFTQSLLKFGLREENFSFILDNDPAKINQRLYGTNLYVRSPKILKDVVNPIVVLKAGQYTEEIKKDILENINPQARFIL